jgi:hypothetical protein
MDRVYDIFERLPDKSLVLRGCAKGLDEAHARLNELARKSENEFHAMHTPTKEIVARSNVGGAAGK